MSEPNDQFPQHEGCSNVRFQQFIYIMGQNINLGTAFQEEVDSDASYRPPKKETRQTYQSADGRTIFWLPENVQIDQISHPHMMVVGEASGNAPQSTSADSVVQKEETLAATEAIENNMAADHHEQENGEQDGDENGQKADTFVVQLYADQVAQQEDGTGADQTAPRNSPRKVVVSHASSSHKIKKDHSKKRPKNSHDDRDSFLRSGKRRSHLIEDSPERDVFNGQNTSRISGDLLRDDPFDHFGKYIASLLRNLPNKRTAVKLQRDILNLVLKEQLFYET